MHPRQRRHDRSGTASPEGLASPNMPFPPRDCPRFVRKLHSERAEAQVMRKPASSWTMFPLNLHPRRCGCSDLLYIRESGLPTLSFHTAGRAKGPEIGRPAAGPLAPAAVNVPAMPAILVVRDKQEPMSRRTADGAVLLSLGRRAALHHG